MSHRSLSVQKWTLAAAKPAVQHLVEPGAIALAQQLAVQYRTFCGLAKWPPGELHVTDVLVRDESDIPGVPCPLCMLEWRRWDR
jgi:hypothetical protein